MDNFSAPPFQENEPPRPTDTPPFQGGERDKNQETHSSPILGEVAEGRRGILNEPPRPTDTPPFQGGERETHSSPILGEVAEGRRGNDKPPRPTDTPPFQGGELETHSSPDTGEVAEGRRGFLPDSGEVAEGRRGQINNLTHLKTFRKELRNNLTPAEAKLWTLLKGKQLEGRKFRRQHSVANYILDFYCPEERLAIELDGQVHFEASQAEYDYERDLFLQYFGIRVLRFENKWLWNNPAGLLEQVKSYFGMQPPHSSPIIGEVAEGRRGNDKPPRPTDTPPFQGGERDTHSSPDTGEVAEGRRGNDEPPRPTDTPPLKAIYVR
jgi:very-short-patch-repair endonuclease